MSKIKELYEKLDEMGYTIGGLTPGPNATPEGVAREILESLIRIENGDCEEILIDV